MAAAPASSSWHCSASQRRRRRVLGRTGSGRISSVVARIEWASRPAVYNIRSSISLCGCQPFLRADPDVGAVERVARGLVVSWSGTADRNHTVLTPGSTRTHHVGATDDRGTVSRRRHARLVLPLSPGQPDSNAKPDLVDRAAPRSLRVRGAPWIAVPRPVVVAQNGSPTSPHGTSMATVVSVPPHSLQGWPTHRQPDQGIPRRNEQHRAGQLKPPHPIADGSGLLDHSPMIRRVTRRSR